MKMFLYMCNGALNFKEMILSKFKKIFLYNDQKSFFSYFLNDNIFMHELERLPLHKRLFKSNAKCENKDLENNNRFQNIRDAKMLSNTLDILDS